MEIKDERKRNNLLIVNSIEANSSKSLHHETQQASKTEKMWYLVIVFCILIGLAVLAVFYMKGKHHSSNNPSIDAKNPSHKNYKKNDNNRSKSLNP